MKVALGKGVPIIMKERCVLVDSLQKREDPEAQGRLTKGLPGLSRKPVLGNVGPAQSRTKRRGLP